MQQQPQSDNRGSRVIRIHTWTNKYFGKSGATITVRQMGIAFNFNQIQFPTTEWLRRLSVNVFQQNYLGEK